MAPTDDDEGPKVEVIQAAVLSIRSGIREIDEVFDQARGPLPKSSIRELTQQVKELRATAEAAEDAFRDWTVHLSGRPEAAAERAEQASLRKNFELEVAALQQTMTRVAGEVVRRKSLKAEPRAAEAEAVPSAASAPADPAHEPPPMPEHEEAPGMLGAEGRLASVLAAYEQRSNDEQPRHQGRGAAADASAAGVARRPPPPPRRTPPPGRGAASASLASPQRAAEPQERVVTSHATLRDTLQQLARRDDEVKELWECSGLNCSERPSKPAFRERIGGLHPFMKYILCVVVTSLGYMIWSHARMLAHAMEMRPESHHLEAHALPVGHEIVRRGSSNALRGAVTSEQDEAELGEAEPGEAF